jgi:hypothetical protein
MIVTVICIFNKTPQLAISDILTQLKVFVFVKKQFYFTETMFRMIDGSTLKYKYCNEFSMCCKNYCGLLFVVFFPPFAKNICEKSMSRIVSKPIRIFSVFLLNKILELKITL